MKTDFIYKLFETESAVTLDAHLTLLADVVQSFASSLEINQTLANAIETFILYLNAEAASIFLLTDDKTELVCRSCAGPVDITGLILPASMGIVGKTVLSGSSQIVRDARKDPDFAKNVDNDTGFETRSILCAPLLVQNDCIGALELINKRGGDGLFDKRDENVLVALASAAALAIHNARMADRLIAQERIQKELELAREIQVSLLPVSKDGDFPVQGLNYPAREVSGDFYDFFQRDDGMIYFNLADVSGKGMNAALLMAKTSSLLHHLAKDISDPGELLKRVNDEICETVSHGMFVTLVSGFIDPIANTVKFSNAGHQPPLFHSQDNKFVELQATAPPLGIKEDMDFPVTTLTLDGGSLYVYTDGVTESMDEEGNELAVAGLIELIKSNTSISSSKRLDSIVSQIRKPHGNQHDDITILLIEKKQDTEILIEITLPARADSLAQIRSMVKRALETAGCNNDLNKKLVVAVSEACMNVIQHAYKNVRDGEFELILRKVKGHVYFRLTDHAEHIDLDKVKSRELDDIRPGGLGVYFIREIMDDYSIGHLPGEKGNFLEMVKKIE